MAAFRIAALAPFAAWILPATVVLAARAMTHTDWAASHSGMAAALFVWLVADSLCLAAIAKAPQFRPGLRALLGALTLASLVVMAGASPPVRAAIFSLPPLLATMGLTAFLYLGWTALTVLSARCAGAGWQRAFESVVPRPLLSFALLESRMMRIALLRWNAAPDVPGGAVPFAYHRFLVPMLAALMVLQVIELGVMHLLLMQWSVKAAWIALAISLAGLLWLIGLLKSFRLYPVLIERTGVRVRSGLMIDLFVPFEAIRSIGAPLAGEALKAPTVCNTAILSSPNVALALASTVTLYPPIGRPRAIEHVALRLDDSPAFIAELERRLTP